MSFGCPIQPEELSFGSHSTIMQEVNLPSTWYYADGGGKWESALEVYIVGATKKDGVIVRLYDNGVNVTTNYKHQTNVLEESGGLRVQWRIEQSSNRRAIYTGIVVGKSKEIYTPQFVVASKSSYSREKKRKRNVDREVLSLMQEKIYRLEARVEELETERELENFDLTFLDNMEEGVHASSTKVMTQKSVQ